MNGSERQRLQEEQLKDEIDELRGELGETVESLVHKADIPARAKERGADLAEQALDRGVEVHQQMVKRGGEIGAQARDLYDKVRAQANGRSSEWRDQAVTITERARTALPETPAQRWTSLALAVLALVAAMVILRRVRTS